MYKVLLPMGIQVEVNTAPEILLLIKYCVGADKREVQRVKWRKYYWNNREKILAKRKNK